MKHATITEATFIGDADLRSAQPGGRPIHKILVSFSAAYAAGGHDRTMFGEAVLDFEILDGPLDRVDARGSRWRPF
jgi:hypothetical protein